MSSFQRRDDGIGLGRICSDVLEVVVVRDLAGTCSSAFSTKRLEVPLGSWVLPLCCTASSRANERELHRWVGGFSSRAAKSNAIMDPSSVVRSAGWHKESNGKWSLMPVR